jgi:hypothetical protein
MIWFFHKDGWEGEAPASNSSGACGDGKIPEQNHGAAFAIADLQAARAFARTRRLDLQIALDRLHGGQPMEEVLVFSDPRGKAPAVTIWRASCAMLIQVAGHSPVPATSLREILHFWPRRPGDVWRSLFLPRWK